MRNAFLEHGISTKQSVNGEKYYAGTCHLFSNMYLLPYYKPVKGSFDKNKPINCLLSKRNIRMLDSDVGGDLLKIVKSIIFSVNKIMYLNALPVLFLHMYFVFILEDINIS